MSEASASKPQFEEIDYRETELGELILRRRTVFALENQDVYEIILGNAFLMSSLFTVVEEQLSHLGLAAAESVFPGDKLDVVVGGLGLGYTARAALEHDSVGSLRVIDFLKPVIEWHEQELAPLGIGLNADNRCQYVHADFFEVAMDRFDPTAPDCRYHAVLLDIDHSPDNLLHERHADFYAASGLSRLAAQIHPGGVFALWSDDPPEAGFMNALEEVFERCESHIVKFYNPLRDNESESTVYVARL